VIVGEGPERASLERLASSLALGESVRFAGFQANSAAWMASMDAIVLTSDHEGMPMVVLEALAMGTPVIARAVGGIPEILQPVNPRWLVDSNAPRAMAAAMADVLCESRQRSGRPSMLDARYSADAMARAYRDVYRAASRQ
jgi:glycosyltransferase involved in cell wall biosynthesis